MSPKAEDAAMKLRDHVAKHGIEAPGRHNIKLVFEYLAASPLSRTLAVAFPGSAYAEPPAPKGDGMLMVEGAGKLSARLFHRWAMVVLSIRVSVFPAGRARSRLPGAPFKFEHYFERGSGGDIRFAPQTLILWDGELRPQGPILLYEHVVAVRAHLQHIDSAAFRKMPRKRPQPGPDGSLPASFYRAVLDAYEALVASGQNHPIATLAKRYGTNRNTIKSWLRRGRIYLGDQGEGG